MLREPRSVIKIKEMVVIDEVSQLLGAALGLSNGVGDAFAVDSTIC